MVGSASIGARFSCRASLVEESKVPWIWEFGRTVAASAAAATSSTGTKPTGERKPVLGLTRGSQQRKGAQRRDTHKRF